MRVQSLRFEEELVLQLVRKLDDLVFNRRAVARTDGLNLPRVHRRAMNVLANDAVCFFGRERDVAWHLLLRDLLGAEAKRSGIIIAWLHGKARPIDGAAVEAGRSTGL